MRVLVDTHIFFGIKFLSYKIFNTILLIKIWIDIIMKFDDK
jgi:hypothetical protein